MHNGKRPDPNVIHPIPGYEDEICIKPTSTRCPWPDGGSAILL